MFYLIDLRNWRLRFSSNTIYLRHIYFKGRRLGVLELSFGLAEALKIPLEFNLLLSVFSDLSS
jgi:hypothetical protein